MGNSNAARWAGRWANPSRFQTKLDIRSANLDAAKNAEIHLKNVHSDAVYTAFPTGDGLDMRSKSSNPNQKEMTYHDNENVRSWHAGEN